MAAIPDKTKANVQKINSVLQSSWCGILLVYRIRSTILPLPAIQFLSFRQTDFFPLAAYRRSKQRYLFLYSSLKLPRDNTACSEDYYETVRYGSLKWSTKGCTAGIKFPLRAAIFLFVTTPRSAVWAIQLPAKAAFSLGTQHLQYGPQPKPTMRLHLHVTHTPSRQSDFYLLS